jgi:hypothetical protein
LGPHSIMSYLVPRLRTPLQSYGPPWGVKKGRKCDLATDLTDQRRYKSNKRKTSVAQPTAKYLGVFWGLGAGSVSRGVGRLRRFACATGERVNLPIQRREKAAGLRDASVGAGSRPARDESRQGSCAGRSNLGRAKAQPLQRLGEASKKLHYWAPPLIAGIMDIVELGSSGVASPPV